MRVFLSIFFVLVIGSQNQTYSQVFGLDSSYLIPNKEGYFAERIFELSDSSFLVSYKSKTFHDAKNTFQTLDAFGIYDISKEEIHFSEFPEKINYIGKTGNKLVFSDKRSISTFDLKTLTFKNELALADSSQLVHLDATFSHLYFYDSLNHSILSKNLFSGELLYEFNLNPDFQNYYLDVSSNEKKVCIIIKNQNSNTAKVYFLDHTLHILSNRNIDIDGFPPMASYSDTHFDIIPKTNSENFILKIITYYIGVYFQYHDISETASTLIDKTQNQGLKQISNGHAFQPVNGKTTTWKSINSDIQIRYPTHDFVQINSDFYALDTAGVRKLKDGLIYLDLFGPEQHFEYLSRFHILKYKTNSASLPIFTLEGPGYISNDTVFFDAAGTFMLIGNTVELGTPPQEITFAVLKSNPALNIRSCEHSNFWNLPSDLPISYQIEVQNPYLNELEVGIEGGNATYQNGTLTINNLTDDVLSLNIQSLENEKFTASNVLSCNYYFAFPGSDDRSTFEIYPNPVNGKTFYIRFPIAEKDKIPDLKLYDLNGKEVKFSLFVVDPYNYEIYIPKPLQSIYILKNLSANTSKRLIINN